MTMINKVVYSQWSKPAKDEFVGFNDKEAFANCAELSLIHSLRWFKEVELITDEKGYKFLIEDLQLPFTNVIVKLDEINHIGKVHWALGKIEACTMQKEPFMHQDFDAIWFKHPPKRLLESIHKYKDALVEIILFDDASPEADQIQIYNHYSNSK